MGHRHEGVSKTPRERGLTCKGASILGTACGDCAKCDEEIANLGREGFDANMRAAKERRDKPPEPPRVTLVSAAPARPGDLTVGMLVDGRQQVFVMAAHVAAALAGDIVRALGNSLLYDAGLERAAQIVALRPMDGDLSTAEEELTAAAIAIRECKVRRTR